MDGDVLVSAPQRLINPVIAWPVGMHLDRVLDKLSVTVSVNTGSRRKEHNVLLQLAVLTSSSEYRYHVHVRAVSADAW
jgi:hypothetical protein